MNIAKVIARKLAKGGYTYIGVTDEGKEIQLRKKATRLYANAFYYHGKRVCSGASGLSANFTYGLKPTSYYTPTIEYRVELVT